MVNFKLMIVAMIVVLQVCKASPVPSNEENDGDFSEEENDAAKLFTKDELVLSKSVGITRRELVKGKSFGLTFQEMMKLNALRSKPFPEKFTFADVTKICEIVVPEHTTASNYTAAQEEELRNIVKVIPHIPTKEQLPFIRTSVCGFVSHPQSFGPKFISNTEIRYLRMGAEDVEGLDRVKVAKLMCCIDGGKILNQSKLNALPDEEMNEFEEQWNEFDTANIPQSIKKLCDFLHAKNLVDDNQCKNKMVPVANDTESTEINS